MSDDADRVMLLLNENSDLRIQIECLQAIVGKFGKQLEAANVLAECAAGTAALLGMTYAINIGSRPGWLDKLDDAVAAYRKAKENAE